MPVILWPVGVWGMAGGCGAVGPSVGAMPDPFEHRVPVLHRAWFLLSGAVAELVAVMPVDAVGAVVDDTNSVERAAELLVDVIQQALAGVGELAQVYGPAGMLLLGEPTLVDVVMPSGDLEGEVGRPVVLPRDAGERLAVPVAPGRLRHALRFEVDPFPRVVRERRPYLAVRQLATRHHRARPLQQKRAPARRPLGSCILVCFVHLRILLVGAAILVPYRPL
ncbi:hypothetical protein OZX62_05110 [Bifidobacterium sp. ESL0690]|uniref:hypothetical protein n=1 Tax=Bifidobacterium sp. ESL0690 TaxID=2983214 RepID=UPI0023F62F3F|nr:hypothetical protein [Bifidobacterium sp. ESL0690]WEV47641.1 hypothetical protein OZX62_05110 [Bifidobacterium sp. ESL0690]